MLEKMLESYAAMEPAMKIFVTLGSVSSFVLFVQMIFILLVGGDVDFDLGEVGEGGGTGIFSVRSIGSFLLVLVGLEPCYLTKVMVLAWQPWEGRSWVVLYLAPFWR